MEDESKGPGLTRTAMEMCEPLQAAEELLMDSPSPELEPSLLDQLKMLQSLGQPSIEAFAALPEEDRLKKWGEILGDSEELSLNDFLLHDGEGIESVNYFQRLDQQMGYGATERRLIQEARRFFYERAKFVFPANWVEEFFADPLGQWNDAIPVESLVRRVIIQVDRRFMDGSEIAQYLSRALEFTNIDNLAVEVWTTGALDGSDYKTQDTIRNMAGTVQELIDKFGDRFSIWKMRLEDVDRLYDDCIDKPHDITNWWDGVHPESWGRLRKGTASFQELMQYQILWWKKPPRGPEYGEYQDWYF